MPPGKKHTLDEPECAGRDHDDRSGERELTACGLAARSQRRERGGDDGDDEELTDFHADVEGEQRPAERARRQIHLAQDVGEAEPVDEAERKGDTTRARRARL